MDKMLSKDFLGLNPLDRCFLESGLDLFTFRVPADGGAALWQKHGRTIMKKWSDPGRRPWGWWKFAIPGGTTRKFRAGKKLDLARGGVYLDRRALQFSDFGIVSPGTVAYLELPDATYDPLALGALETDLQLLRRLGQATAEELRLLEEQERNVGGPVADLQATPDAVPGEFEVLGRARQVRDLARQDSDSFPFRYDETAAARVVAFSRLVKHSVGTRFAGKPFILEPWQQFGIVNPLFGWKRTSDSTRRFRLAYLEVARKNGKSTLGAALSLYALCADHEPAAQAFTAALTREQAGIVFSEAERMVKGSPLLRRFVKPLRNYLRVESTLSSMRNLASDSDSLEGLNPNFICCDELSVHEDRELWDVLSTSQGARSQPLMLALTTAGWDRESICWALHERLDKVLKQKVEDEEFTGFVANLDAGDDWRNVAVYHKANPNLGRSLMLKDLVIDLARAEADTGSQNAFRMRRLSQWQESASRFINMEDWKRCGGNFTEEDLRGCECWGGLDVSKQTDYTALCLIFPFERPDKRLGLRLVMRFWLPEATLLKRSKEDQKPFTAWRESGVLKVTPGAIIDYDAVTADIKALLEEKDYRLNYLGLDHYREDLIAPQLRTALNQKRKDEKVQLIAQDWRTITPAIQKMEAAVLEHRLEHGNNPILTMMAGNVIVRSDYDENMRLSKKQSKKRIDGVSALVTGLVKCPSTVTRLAEPDPNKKVSVYARRGMISIGSDGVQGFEERKPEPVQEPDLRAQAAEFWKGMEAAGETEGHTFEEFFQSLQEDEKRGEL